jgi:AraC-like DNA-binding protein
MSFASATPRKHREKVFGAASGHALDGNAKARIMHAAKAYNARYKQDGQHRGPLTRAIMEVLEALLWGFHNARSGLCFPSYETIAAKADCSRDTVYRAINALEAANILTWVNRLHRIAVKTRDLVGKLVTEWKLVRTSNAYVFRDPLPCAIPRKRSKSENPPGTLNQDSSVKEPNPKIIVLDPRNSLDARLIALGRVIGGLPQPE